MEEEGEEEEASHDFQKADGNASEASDEVLCVCVCVCKGVGECESKIEREVGSLRGSFKIAYFFLCIYQDLQLTV